MSRQWSLYDTQVDSYRLKLILSKKCELSVSIVMNKTTHSSISFNQEETIDFINFLYKKSTAKAKDYMIVFNREYIKISSERKEKSSDWAAYFSKEKNTTIFSSCYIKKMAIDVSIEVDTKILFKDIAQIKNILDQKNAVIAFAAEDYFKTLESF